MTSFAWPPPRGEHVVVARLGRLRSCGRLSYGIYLTHMFAVFAVVRWLSTPCERWPGASLLRHRTMQTRKSELLRTAD